MAEQHGIGTKIAEYIETGAPTFCGNCHYVTPVSQTRGACAQKDIRADTEVNKLPSGKGDVSLGTGCCRFWEPIEKKLEPKVNTHDWRKREQVS